MRKLIKIVVAFVLLLIIAVAAGLFYIDSLVKAGVENGATYALGVETKLGAASVGLLSGECKLVGLNIANPDGFKSSHFVKLDESEMAVTLGSLTEDLIEAPKLLMTGLSVNLEKREGKANYEYILENLKRFESTEKADPDPDAKGKRFVIREVILKDIAVEADLLPVGGDLTRLKMVIPEIKLKNVGAEDGQGALIADVSGILIKALLIAIVEKGGGLIPGDIAGELTKGLAQLDGIGSLGIDVADAINKQVVDEVGKVVENVGKDATKAIDKVGKDVKDGVGKAVDDLGKDAGKAIGDLFNKKEEDKK